jgi:hypothetical protein
MTKSAAFVMVTVYIIYLVQAIVMAEGWSSESTGSRSMQSYASSAISKHLIHQVSF